MTAQKKDNIFVRLVQGTLVSGTFFAHNWGKILIVVFMVLLYITNRYSCQRYMSDIRQLNERLNIVRSESYRVRGEYMSRIRESEMREMLDSMHMGLSVQPQPPYHISPK